MFWEPMIAVAVTIVYTLLLFACIYGMSYVIILTGMKGLKRLQQKWQEMNEKD